MLMVIKSLEQAITKKSDKISDNFIGHYFGSIEIGLYRIVPSLSQLSDGTKIFLIAVDNCTSPLSFYLI